VGCVVDRSGGAADLGVPLRSLLALDIPAYPAATCPMCAKGSKPEMPGSRLPTGR
jgi:orotate phosphoribosyltransferase